METTAPPELPDLPDLDALRAKVITRREYFEKIRADAQVEIDRCNDHLAELGVTPIPMPTEPDREKRVPESSYIRVLDALSNRNYANASTLAGDAGFSTSYVLDMMRLAERNGHVAREAHGKRSHRFVLTDLGQDYVTQPRPETQE